MNASVVKTLADLLEYAYQSPAEKRKYPVNQVRMRFIEDPDGRLHSSDLCCLAERGAAVTRIVKKTLEEAQGRLCSEVLWSRLVTVYGPDGGNGGTGYSTTDVSKIAEAREALLNIERHEPKNVEKLVKHFTNCYLALNKPGAVDEPTRRAINGAGVPLQWLGWEQEFHQAIKDICKTIKTRVREMNPADLCRAFYPLKNVKTGIPRIGFNGEELQAAILKAWEEYTSNPKMCLVSISNPEEARLAALLDLFDIKNGIGVLPAPVAETIEWQITAYADVTDLPKEVIETAKVLYKDNPTDLMAVIESAKALEEN